MPAIRRGGTGDWSEIAAIQGASPEAAQWNIGDYGRYDSFVAVHQNQVAGFLVWRAIADAECEILNLAVLPDFRRQGVGRALVQSLLKSFNGPVFLEVRESNEAAIGLYKSLGFEQISRRLEYYREPPEAAIVMKFHSC
ncbi:MAG TPA: ribosomal protein S18-alanine N-acetyltransferase [Bryobacteraceae bacterium]|nr:ribosomal protein S18-alanine N-acetyltransferase [Bryobacteraceae bacterium]